MTTWPISPSSPSCRCRCVDRLYQPRRRRAARRNSRWIALWTTLITFAVSLILVWRFDPTQPDFQFVEKARGLPIHHLSHGRDGISLPFVILTTGLMPICILASWKSGNGTPADHDGVLLWKR